MMLLALYIDDGLLASTNVSLRDSFLKTLQEFQITIKQVSYFLKLEIVRNEDGTIDISQATYERKVSERFDMQNCKPISLLMVKEDIQVWKESEEELKITFPYRKAVGALMYLMAGTRINIGFAVSIVSRNFENPSNADVFKVKRIFCNLKGTKELGLIEMRYTRGAENF